MQFLSDLSTCSTGSTVPAVQYSTVQYSTVQRSTVQYTSVQYSTVQYSTVQYIQYSSVPYSTVQYSTVQYSTEGGAAGSTVGEESASLATLAQKAYVEELE